MTKVSHAYEGCLKWPYLVGMRHDAHLIRRNALLVDTDDQGRVALVKVVSGYRGMSRSDTRACIVMDGEHSPGRHDDVIVCSQLVDVEGWRERFCKVSITVVDRLIIQRFYSRSSPCLSGLASGGGKVITPPTCLDSRMSVGKQPSLEYRSDQAD